MQTEIFIQWFRHFLRVARPGQDHPILLVLDGHSTHTKNLEVLKIAKENNVHILCLPPHCTHRMQKLDVAFMQPLKQHYDDAVRTWIRSHKGRLVTIYQMAQLFGEAYLKAAKIKTAMSGFSATGIWPVNPSVFTDSDFTASDRPPADSEIISHDQQVTVADVPSIPVEVGQLVK